MTTVRETPAGEERSSRRVLDPIERISEILFGLIMVMSFTGSLSVATAGREEVREMLVGAIGCNMAWGIVDAVMYLMSTLLQRRRDLMTIRAVRGARDAGKARDVIVDALPPVVASLLRAEHLDHIRETLIRQPEPAARAGLKLSDLIGALGVFLLVFASTFPVVLPFVFIADAHLGLRVSNTIAIVLLFAGGVILARHAGLSPFRTGLAMVGVGAVLVLITVALGG